MSKIFAKNCKRLVSKVSCLVSVSERSSLGLVSSFCSKSRSRLGLATSMSGLGLEDFGRDSSSASVPLPIKCRNYSVQLSYIMPCVNPTLFDVRFLPTRPVKEVAGRAWVPIFVEHWGEGNLQFYPSFALFLTLGG